MITQFLILFALALGVSAIGWARFVWFFSVGYGYSITALSVATAIIAWPALNWISGLMLLMLALYGVRLSTYLLVRELKNRAYVKTVDLDVKHKADYPIGVVIAVWVSCALLYVGEMTPAVVRAVTADVTVAPGTGIAGLVIAAIGVLVEAIADKQKNNAKKLNPKRFVDSGLYKIVRCPNYFGEILLWTGVFVSGIGCYQSWWHWALALLGYIGIVYVMFSGTRRIELRQAANYGNDPEFQAYIRKTPILLPCVPIYSVAKYKWLKG